MRSYVNPFRVPQSERLREDRTFLRNFAVPMLDVLPDDPWDIPIIVRSPQGGGKTSLLRIFTTESLDLVAAAPSDYHPALAAKLNALDALNSSGPRHLGVLLNLERDYRELADIDAPEEVSQRLFFKLLDSRIIVAIMRAALELRKLQYPQDINRFELRSHNGSSVNEIIFRLGGYSGEELFNTARRNEIELLNLLDSLLTVNWADQKQGHADLYSLRVLSQSDITVDGLPLDLRPLILLDDGHFLDRSQRSPLLRRLAARDLNVGRWYSERSEALSPQEIIAETGTHGRDHFLVELSGNSIPRGTRKLPYDKMALEVADSRPHRSLERYADEQDNFTELITVPDSDLTGSSSINLLELLTERLDILAGREERYLRWMEEMRGLAGYHGAVSRRELEILITRDRARQQEELFSLPLDPTELQRRSSSAVREAASLFMAREYGLPYYAGPKNMVKLGSHNMAQFIALCGDLFEEMLGAMTLRHKPRLNAKRQDVLVRRASERLWREIPQRLVDGRLVHRLLWRIAVMAQRETYRPNAPYAPGVTGIAIAMHDRERLLRSGDRREMAGLADLRTALGAAIIDNMLTAELYRSVKNESVMVLYLNRLLCPRFRLPLGRGGFMVMKLPTLCGWMLDAELSEPPVGEQFTL